MRQFTRCCLIVFCLFPMASAARAQDTTLDLILQVQRMQQWLGTGPHADGWRRYLLLNQLESQAVKAWRGDPQTVNAILQRFESGQPGLEHPIFDGVRRTLREHARQLPGISGDLDVALAGAEAAYVPVTAEQLAQEVKNLQAEIQICRNRYASTLTADNFAVAVTDLRLDELNTLSGGLDFSPRPDNGEASKKQQDDLRTLRSILLHFNERSPKQNDRFFAVVRRQLEKTFLKYSQWLQADPRAEFVQHLSKLKTDLPKILDSQQRAAQGEFALELGWLDATGHAPQVVAAARAKYMLPNVRFLVTETMARQVGTRPVQNNRPVSENILGRQICGNASTTGTVELDFVEDPDQAHISIHMQGYTVSDSYTRQGPITAFSGSYANVEARRSFFANVGGITEFAPYVAANLSSEFRGTDCIRLVDKLANQQYLKDRAASEAIGARRMETKLINEFEMETSNAIRQSREQIAKALADNKSKVGFIPAIYVRTTNDALLGYGIKTDTFQLSAPSDPPATITVPAEMVVQIHESMLDNYLEPLLARQTIRNTEFGQKLEEWFETKPKVSTQPASDEMWSITFTQSRPVQFMFDGNLFGVAIAGSRFTRDEEYRDRDTGERKVRAKETIDEPMMIRINFRMQRDKGELVLAREGRAVVEFTRDGVKTVPKNAFRSFLEDVLNKNLREQEAAEANAADSAQAGFRIPANLISVERMKDPTVAKNLDLVVLRSDQGWVTAAWRPASFNNLGARVTNAVDTPAIFDAPAAPPSGK